MKIETLLPMGKTDPGLRRAQKTLDITSVFDDAARVESIGFDTLVVEETKDDPYLIMALAAQATSRLKLATSVAMAFPRSPTITAMSAWRLQTLSAGRFTLGLGTQVRGHIVRRFGLDYSAVGPWMIDYVEAVRAVWDCWQNGTDLRVANDHYDLSLMVPLFNPGPIEYPDIPLHIAAINPAMARVAGQIADGVRLHPVCTPEYIDTITSPNIAAGAEQGGRRADAVEICMKPLLATAATDEQLEARVRDVRARIAFYASTPSYRRAFDLHGLGDLAEHMKQLSKAQRWEEMPALIDDDVLHTYVTIGKHDVIADRLRERYAGRVDRLEFSIAVDSDEDAETMSSLIASLS